MLEAEQKTCMLSPEECVSLARLTEREALRRGAPSRGAAGQDLMSVCYSCLQQ